MRLSFSVLFFLITLNSALAVEIRAFSDTQKQETYERVIKEVRCLVCQNQSLADSDAELAEDLRTEVFRLVERGESESSALEFLTSRYGDFVLYRPPLKPATYFLWFGPILFVLAGYFFMISQRRAKGGQGLDAPMTERERMILDQVESELNATGTSKHSSSKHLPSNPHD
jgi:cytochrome c-type biogenesis protein CcmH